MEVVLVPHKLKRDPLIRSTTLARASKRWRGDRGRKLLSQDERLFEDGTMTLGDTITRGFWDQTHESRP